MATEAAYWQEQNINRYWGPRQSQLWNDGKCKDVFHLFYNITVAPFFFIYVGKPLYIIHNFSRNVKVLLTLYTFKGFITDMTNNFVTDQ